jgi:hypothetical protein
MREKVMKTSNLIRWIDSHNMAEPTTDNGDGTLNVSCTCVNTHLPEGHAERTFIERSVIPASLSAARNYLGY